MSIADIKDSNSILDLAGQYCELVKIGANCFKAKENPLRSEKTSSLHFYVDSNRFTDFGTGLSGDILDFMQAVENIDRAEAMKRLSGNYSLSVMPKSLEPVREEPKTDTPQAIEIDFNYFLPLTFGNPEHKKELLEVAPLWLYGQANKTDLDFFKSQTRFDNHNKTLVAAWCENTDLGLKMVTYKRRRHLGGKWVNRKNTKPNAVAFCRIYSDEPVYIVEGTHDMLSAILLGINFIALPTASFKNVTAIKKELGGREAVYIVEDLQSFNCMELLQKETGGRLIALCDFNEIAKFDLSDFVATKNSIEEVLNGL